MIVIPANAIFKFQSDSINTRLCVHLNCHIRPLNSNLILLIPERIDPIDAIIDAWKHAMKEEYRPDVNETVNEWLEQFEKYMKKGGEK